MEKRKIARNSRGTHIEVLNSTKILYHTDAESNTWHLALEKGIWHYESDDWADEEGYRFIWYNNNKKLGHRGQARIPDVKYMLQLIAMASIEGWLNIKDANVSLTVN